MCIKLGTLLHPLPFCTKWLPLPDLTSHDPWVKSGVLPLLTPLFPQSLCNVNSFSMLEYMALDLLCSSLKIKHTGPQDQVIKHMRTVDFVFQGFMFPNTFFIKWLQTSWHTVSLEVWGPWTLGLLPTLHGWESSLSFTWFFFSVFHCFTMKIK